MLDENTDHGILEKADHELIMLATKQIGEKQYRGACEILEKVRRRRGINSTSYKLASDAYIGIENFKEAEIMALTAFINGEKTVANCVNLASLAAMRKDQLMARFWLPATRIDKSDENINKCKELLFPQNKARGMDKPFEISG